MIFIYVFLHKYTVCAAVVVVKFVAVRSFMEILSERVVVNVFYIDYILVSFE